MVMADDVVKRVAERVGCSPRQVELVFAALMPDDDLGDGLLVIHESREARERRLRYRRRVGKADKMGAF
jgi:hypothetical protein